MSLFSVFRKSQPISDEPNPKITYGFRREGIIYEIAGKEIEVDFTCITGDRIYTETITKWNDGTEITDNEKRKILIDLLRFTKGWFSKSIVVINTDDPSQPLWLQICEEMSEFVSHIEYTSNETNRQIERQMYVEILNSKAELIIDGITIEDEQQLDDVLAVRQKNR